jgi:hypothetical protein
MDYCVVLRGGGVLFPWQFSGDLKNKLEFAFSVVGENVEINTNKKFSTNYDEKYTYNWPSWLDKQTHIYLATEHSGRVV